VIFVRGLFAGAPSTHSSLGSLGTLLALCALLPGAVQAADVPPAVGPATTAATPELKPARKGYAVDQPRILLRQRLFGRAHGLTLLTAACLDLPAYSKPVQDAYATWHAKQGNTIEAIVRDLADYYFGPRAGEAQWSDLSRALNLPDSIQPALGEVTLHAACASLPEAIPRQRYALDKLLAGSADAEPAANDAVAVPPAPTFQKPAE
jgi:hypothetical protein